MIDFPLQFTTLVVAGDAPQAGRVSATRLLDPFPRVGPTENLRSTTDEGVADALAYALRFNRGANASTPATSSWRT